MNVPFRFQSIHQGELRRLLRLTGSFGLIRSPSVLGRGWAAYTKTANPRRARSLWRCNQQPAVIPDDRSCPPVEAAWAYWHRPNVQGRVLRRQKSLALCEEAKRIAWKAQQRLYKRFTALAARGKENNVIAIAIARELLGFMWAIGIHTESQSKTAKAA